MTRLTISLLIVSFILASGITAVIMTAINDKKIKQLIEINKRAAVTEYKLRDSLKYERGMKESLAKSFKLRGDSLKVKTQKIQHIETVIRYIHPLPLPADSLEILLTKRHYYTSPN